MKYAIDVLRSAQKRLAKLSPQDQDRIVAAIAGLSEAPRPAGSQKLTGRDAMRIRVGDYRVISPDETQARMDLDPDSPALKRGWEFWARESGCAHLLED